MKKQIEIFLTSMKIQTSSWGQGQKEELGVNAERARRLLIIQELLRDIQYFRKVYPPVPIYPKCLQSMMNAKAKKKIIAIWMPSSMSYIYGTYQP